jgi:hypothetical protein
MNIIFPIIELIDRLAIAEVKWEKTQSNAEELSWYQTQVEKYNQSIFLKEYTELKDIHRTIWALESDLKSGFEDRLSLEEIGRRAILIRDHNKKRIELKNIVAEKVKCHVREIKKDHLSDSTTMSRTAELP